MVVADITLDDEQRRWIAASLQKVTRDADGKALEALCHAVEASIAAWQHASAPKPTFRQTHDQQRELWYLAREPDPKPAIIRQRFAALPASIIMRLEGRAGRLWQRSLGQALPTGSLLDWVRHADLVELIHGVQVLIGEGGQLVRGRLRPGGRRSALRLEPLIDGVVRGGARDIKRKRGVGRRPELAADQLVMMLAIDWLQATGKSPSPGRSDGTPFGALVHHIFSWVGQETAAEPALRRYWRSVAAERRRRSKALR
jgi:hypothetical protein